MNSYSWHGTDDRGRVQRGECSAAGLVEAAEQLRARGLAPFSLSRVGEEPSAPISPAADAFTLFNRSLSEMTAVGLPLPRAIREISSGLRRGRFRRGLEQVEAAVREGKPIEEAVAAVPGIFPAYYESMLRAGAASGNLPGVLAAVARNTEGVRLARRAMLEALIYPALILLAAVLLGAGAMLFFVPYYRELCARHSFDAPIGLPLFLRAFESVPAVLALVLGGAGAVAAMTWFVRATVAGERFLRRLPFLGRIRDHLTLARLLGSLGVMLRSGVPLPRALPVALGAAGSLEIDRASSELAGRASEGGGLGEVLGRVPSVRPEIAAYLSLSERTGTAAGATLQVAELLSEQAQTESEALFIILMPAALVAAGVIVASALIAVVAPFVQFLESLRL
jgi:type II secretory pathway component PulF